MAETNTDPTADNHASAGTTALALMNLRFANLRAVGMKMRDAQKRYFKTRDRNDLIASKQLEKQFDELLK